MAQAAPGVLAFLPEEGYYAEHNWNRISFILFSFCRRGRYAPRWLENAGQRGLLVSDVTQWSRSHFFFPWRPLLHPSFPAPEPQSNLSFIQGMTGLAAISRQRFIDLLMRSDKMRKGVVKVHECMSNSATVFPFGVLGVTQQDYLQSTSLFLTAPQYTGTSGLTQCLNLMGNLLFS